MKLEEKLLQSFIKYMGDEVKGLDLIIAFSPDTFPDDEGVYSFIVMEREDNGKVWDCECTRSGKIKDVIEP